MSPTSASGENKIQPVDHGKDGTSADISWSLDAVPVHAVKLDLPPAGAKDPDVAIYDSARPSSEGDSRTGTPNGVRQSQRHSALSSIASSLLSASSPEVMCARATINIAISYFGVSNLSLPNGVALLAHDQAVYLGTGLLVMVAVACGFGWFLIGAVCEWTKSATYIEAWSKSLKRCGGIALTFLMYESLLAACMPNVMVTADAVVNLLSPYRESVHPAAGWLMGRGGVLLVFSVLQFPIVLQKNFRRLVKLSILATTGFCFVVAVIIIRWADGSYAEGGRFADFQEQALQDVQDYSSMFAIVPGLSAMILISRLINSLCGHSAAAAICRELPVQTGPDRVNRKVKLNGKIIAAGYLVGGTLTLVTMLFGYLLFGDASKGNLLENFHQDDALGTAAKLVIAIANFSVFPLKFKPLRDKLIYVLGMYKTTPMKFRLLTAVQLVGIALPCVFLTDLGLVQALGGATSSVFVAMLAPAMMTLAVAKSLPLKALNALLFGAGALCLIGGLAAIFVEQLA